MDHDSSPQPLSPSSFLEGVDYLVKVDPDLAKITNNFGNPPRWSREPGFQTLVHIILEQQVSLASARAVFDKLTDSVGQLSPEKFLDISDEDLRGFGFSRQKTEYCRELSKTILDGELNLEALTVLDDASVRIELTKIKGIGPWTADIYLLMALQRPDIWPTGDLALAKAVQAIKRLPSPPSQEMLAEISIRWKPWRAVAARMLWHYYLNGR